MSTTRAECGALHPETAHLCARPAGHDESHVAILPSGTLLVWPGAPAAPADVTVYELRTGPDDDPRPETVAQYATLTAAAEHGEAQYRAQHGTAATLEWPHTGTDQAPRYRLMAVDDLDGEETLTDWHIVPVLVPATYTPPALTVTRTQAEIVARARAADDFFEWALEVLLPYCTYTTALPLLTEGTTADDWAEAAQDPAKVGEKARAYYGFALGKIADHRGISAERSVIKLREYAWLMGRDDVVAAMDAAPYPEYGAPKVAAFAAGMGYAAEAGAR